MTRKKNCIKLSNLRKKQIKKWLANFQIGTCPIEQDHKICQSWFPKITNNKCPCQDYSDAHLVATAIRMIEK
jgi:hypothetical protein